MSIAVSPAQPAVVALLFLTAVVLSAAQSGEVQYLCPVSQEPVKLCPARCSKSNPVCGQNGITYWCGCPDAACSQETVVKKGVCGVGNGGRRLFSGQAFLLGHIIWLIVPGFSILCGLL